MHQINRRCKRKSALRQPDIECVGLDNLRVIAVKRVSEQHRLLKVRTDQPAAQYAANRQDKNNDACALQTGERNVQ